MLSKINDNSQDHLLPHELQQLYFVDVSQELGNSQSYFAKLN